MSVVKENLLFLIQCICEAWVTLQSNYLSCYYSVIQSMPSCSSISIKVDVVVLVWGKFSEISYRFPFFLQHIGQNQSIALPMSGEEQLYCACVPRRKRKLAGVKSRSLFYKGYLGFYCQHAKIFCLTVSLFVYNGQSYTFFGELLIFLNLDLGCFISVYYLLFILNLFYN